MTIINKIHKTLFSGILLGLLILVSCKKQGIEIPPTVATFASQTAGSYFVENTPTTVFKIPVGITNVANVDRQVNFTITSPTGAAAGTHYTVSSSPVTVPAGEALVYIEVKGIFAEYSSGRKDSLVVTLETPDPNFKSYNSTFKLFMRGPCFDGDVDDISIMAGDYDNTLEDGGAYGPYTASIGTITPTSATTATAKIDRVFDLFGPLDIEFDWTDPNNTVVSIPLQQTDQDYDVGQPFLVRTSPGEINKFSVCNNRITLTIDVIVANYFGPGQHAYYAQNYEMIMNK